jgi:hypothetical protein
MQHGKSCISLCLQLFYFGTIVSSVVVENVVSERRAMKFEISDNGTISGTLIIQPLSGICVCLL